MEFQPAAFEAYADAYFGIGTVSVQGLSCSDAISDREERLEE